MYCNLGESLENLASYNLKNLMDQKSQREVVGALEKIIESVSYCLMWQICIEILNHESQRIQFRILCRERCQAQVTCYLARFAGEVYLLKGLPDGSSRQLWWYWGYRTVRAIIELWYRAIQAEIGTSCWSLLRSCSKWHGGIRHVS